MHGNSLHGNTSKFWYVTSLDNVNISQHSNISGNIITVSIVFDWIINKYSATSLVDIQHTSFTLASNHTLAPQEIIHSHPRSLNLPISMAQFDLCLINVGIHNTITDALSINMEQNSLVTVHLSI